MKKPDNYLKEVKIHHILDHLDSINKRITSLKYIYSKRGKIDKETKQNIIDIYELTLDIFNIESDKELKQQKKEGKEFLSDNEIDKIINDEIKKSNND